MELQDALQLSRRGATRPSPPGKSAFCRRRLSTITAQCRTLQSCECGLTSWLFWLCCSCLRARVVAVRCMIQSAEYEEMESEKDRIIADRDMEIEQLQKKMEDMSSEFAEMLKETLDRMSQKIEQESANMGAGDTDPALSAKLSEFKLGFVDI